MSAVNRWRRSFPSQDARRSRWQLEETIARIAAKQAIEPAKKQGASDLELGRPATRVGWPSCSMLVAFRPLGGGAAWALVRRRAAGPPPIHRFRRSPSMASPKLWEAIPTSRPSKRTRERQEARVLGSELLQT